MGRPEGTDSLRLSSPAIPSQNHGLGVGVGYRAELAELITESPSIQWVELIAEHFLGRDTESLREFAERLGRPAVCHGLEYSMGYSDETQVALQSSIGALCDAVESPWYSDHLCFTRLGEINLGLLGPLFRSNRAAARVRDNAVRLAHAIGRPVLLENVAYLYDPGGDLTEAEFTRAAVEAPELGLLLDLSNLFNNAANHGYDPYQFLHEIPREKVLQVHIAGASFDGALWRDTHASRVHEGVWELLDFLVSNLGCQPSVLLEWDSRFPADLHDSILADVHRASAILGEPCG